MKRNNVKYRNILIGGGIAFIAGIVYYNNIEQPINVREHYSDLNKQTEVLDKKGEGKVPETLTQFFDPKAAASEAAKQKFQRDYRLLENLFKLAKKRDARCTKWLTKYLVNDDFRSVNSTIYQDRENILWLMKMIFREVYKERSNRRVV